MLNILSNLLKLYKETKDETLLHQCIDLAQRLELMVAAADALRGRLISNSSQSTELPSNKGSFRWLFREIPYATKANNDCTIPDSDDPLVA